MSIKFDFLEHGDCTIVTTDEFTMMIDGGYSHPFEAFEFEGPIPTIDSVVVTHIDRDHIGGVIDCFQDEAIVKNLKHVVFNEPESFAEFVSPSNTTEVNIDDGNLLSTVIKANPNIKPWSWICTKTKRLDRSITGSTRQTKFTVLSPPEHLLQKLFDKWDKNLFKEDTSIFGKADDFRSVTELINTKENYNDNSSTPNGSSLAFLIEHKNNKFMILGDAYVTQITKQLRNMGFEDKAGGRLLLDFIKLSHHGSKKSTSLELLSLIETENYVISNPSTTRMPDRETIARIAVYGNSNGKTKKIFVNNSDIGDLNFSESEMRQFSFSINPTSAMSFEYL